MTEYEVTLNGVPTTVLLSDEDARRYPGAKPADPKQKQAPAPANKAAVAANK